MGSLLSLINVPDVAMLTVAVDGRPVKLKPATAVAKERKTLSNVVSDEQGYPYREVLTVARNALLAGSAC